MYKVTTCILYCGNFVRKSKTSYVIITGNQSFDTSMYDLEYSLLQNSLIQLCLLFIDIANLYLNFGRTWCVIGKGRNK